MLYAIGDDREPKPSTSSSTQPSQPCRHFDFAEILIATENFDESLVIGSGGFGKVYKGNIINGASLVVAAIKRLDSMSNQGATEFWTEVKMLSMLRQCNLVSLIGYCNYEKEMILMYEYMPNGTLDDHLHKLHTPLSWVRRLDICIGAGRGLRYLHDDTGIDSGVIHGDFKSSNILLHESWTAKISDFGLSKTCPKNQPSTYVNTHVKGSFGYLDPNYFRTGRLTRRSDVYAFGVVLFEVLGRKRALDGSLYGEDRNLATWAQDSIKEGNLKRIIDSHIKDEIYPQCLKKFVRIAERCLHDNPEHRPTMANVVVSLETILAIQEKVNMQPAGSRTIFGRMVNKLPFSSNGENSDSQSLGSSLKEFRFDDLKEATREFSPDLLLGRGDIGEVFLGWVDGTTFAPSKQGDGLAVAVRRLSHVSDQGYVEWLNEVNFLGHLTHPNIITLLGYCRYKPNIITLLGYNRNKHEHLLVYEYMPNKGLDRFLFKDGIAKRPEPLSWKTRILIMLGVASGLTYLHSRDTIFSDLTSSHILLDEDFSAKLNGLALARYCPGIGETHVSTGVTGTLGYLDPDYCLGGRLTKKTDIYAFGVVLLESITGRRSLDYRQPGAQLSLVEWANQIQSEGRNVKEMMDPRLEHNYPLQGASECVALALRCVAEKPKDRPPSEEVLQSLEQIYAHNK